MTGIYELEGKRIWVAGHRGMVGSALVRRLASDDCEVLTVGREALDLRDAAGVDVWLAARRPHVVLLAAAKVGGIAANERYPVEFLRDNLLIETAVIEAAAQHAVERLVFLGSSCVYPKHAKQPIREESLLSGPLEPTNEWYAIAKIAGIKLCQAHWIEEGSQFLSVMPSNLYGPHDNFDLETSHVLPALMRKIHAAKVGNESEVVLWGTGTPRREFLHVDDCADAVVHVLKHHQGADPINIGVGDDISIQGLAELIADVVGFRGTFVHDTTRPDGTPRKLLDISRLQSLGWSPRIALRDGISTTYRWFQQAYATGAD